MHKPRTGDMPGGAFVISGYGRDVGRNREDLSPQAVQMEHSMVWQCCSNFMGVILTS